MSTPGMSGISWVCPKCSRRVPSRIDTCRCGTPRPGSAAAAGHDAAVAATPAPIVPGAAAAAVVAAPPYAAPPPPISPGSGAPPPVVAAPPPLPRAAAAPPATARAAVSPAATPYVGGGGFDESLRTSKERTLFGIALAFSGLFWLALVVTIVGIPYGLIGLLVSLIVHAMYLAHVRGNALRVSERQLPDVYATVVRASQALGLEEVPEVYVSQAGGVLNAFATKFFTRKFVILYSDLVEACQDPRQLEFVIGHEVGHLAAGHLKWNAFLWPFMLVPLLGMAYSRAREYTCDRCGLAVVNDPDAAMRGLIVLAAGGKQAARADVASFMEQRLETGRFWSAVVELGSTHPFLCKRVAAMQEYLQPGSAPPVSRNPLAYPVAPFFAFGGAVGGGAASLLIVVAIVGIIAAIAIPSLLRARVSANEAAALGNLRTVASAEATYSRMAGVYGPMSCLVSPANCLGGTYRGPALLDATTAAEVQAGYRHELTVSEDGREFAYVVSPLTPGTTGVRSFCTDARGLVCFGADPDLTDSTGAACDPSRCHMLQ